MADTLSGPPELPTDGLPQSDQVQPEEGGLLFNPIQIAPLGEKDSPDREVELLKEMIDGFNKRRMWRQPFEDLWNRIYRLYITKAEVSGIPTRSKVVLAKVFQAVEAAVPKILSIVFGKEPWFDVVSRWSMRPVPMEVLNNIRALIDFQLSSDQANFYPKFLVFCKQLVMYGTSYLTVTWKVRREWVTERVADRTPITILGVQLPSFGITWVKQKSLKVVERRPEITVLPIEAVYPSPSQTTVDGADGVYWLDTILMEDLEELSKGRVPVYGNINKVKEAMGSAATTGRGGPGSLSPAINVTQAKAAARDVNDPQNSAVGDKSIVQLIHFWGKRDLDGDGFREEVHIVLANQAVIIRAVANPYEHQKRPLIVGRLFPLVNEWFGMGMVEPAIATIAGINTLTNQNIDMNNMIINRMWKADPTLDVDLDTLISVPNGVVLSSPLDAVAELQANPIPFSPVQLIQTLEQEVESTMAPKSIQGTPESGALGRTARGAQLIIGQALEKYGTVASLLERTVLLDMFTQMHQLNAQYLDQDEFLQDIYKNIFPTKPTPEQIRSEVNFKFLGMNETITKEATVNQINAYVATWAPFAPAMGLDLRKLAREHYSLLDLKTPAEEILPDMPPVPVMVQPGAGQSPQSAALLAQLQTNGGASGGIALPPAQ